MYILYLDESGNPERDDCFVLAGIALFERQTWFRKQDLDRLQEEFFPWEHEPIEFHASHLRRPDNQVKPPFDTLSLTQRRTILDRIYGTISQANAHVFAAVIDKNAIEESRYDRAFQEVVHRFDLMLQRMYNRQGDAQRGLVVLAEAREHRRRLEALARAVWNQGHYWGQLRNMADIPYFALARSTRLLQLADFTANAIYGRYAGGHTRHFNVISDKFDRADGKLHGLVHLTRDTDCLCPACDRKRATLLAVRTHPGIREDPDELYVAGQELKELSQEA